MYELTSFKQPEQNLDLPNEYVERLILKKFMTDPQYTPFISENFKEEYFDNSTVRCALYMGSGYYKKFNSIPPMELLTNLLLGWGKNEEASLVASYANINIEAEDLFIQATIKGFYQQKAFFYLVFANSEKIMKDRDVTPYISELQRISSLDFNFDLGFNYFKNIEEHIFDLTTPEKRLDTGYNQLNNLCNGGFPEDGKCLIVLMAQAGLGKSMTMHNLASNMIPLGKKVLIVSLEMTEQIYSRRISANMTCKCIDSLNDEDNITAIRENVENINTIDGAGLIIKEFPPSALRAITLGNYIERLILSGFKPDIIFVDYLNLMMPNNAVHGGGSYERVGDIAKELRALSYIFGVPIISATQSNRCLTLDTKVTLNGKETEIRNVKVGDKILSENGENIITNVFPTTKQRVYEITTESGKRIKCSAKHLFPVGKNKKLKSLISGLSYFDELLSVGLKNIILDKIVEITCVGCENTIDITTDNNNLFIANNILTHNSGFNTSDIDMEHISESAQIAHHADALFALHSDIETAPNDFYLKVLKNRFGGKINSRIQFNMNYDNLRLTEIDFNRTPEPEQLTETNSLVEDITKELNI